MNGLVRSLAFVAFVASACAEEIKVPGGLIDVELLDHIQPPGGMSP